MKMCFSFVTATLFLVGTVLTTSVQAKPDEVSEADVANCQFLEKVYGSSGYGKNQQWHSLAKINAEKKAGSLGATHIVVNDYRQTGSFNGEAEVKAYVCH